MKLLIALCNALIVIVLVYLSIITLNSAFLDLNAADNARVTRGTFALLSVAVMWIVAAIVTFTTLRKDTNR